MKGNYNPLTDFNKGDEKEDQRQKTVLQNIGENVTFYEKVLYMIGWGFSAGLTFGFGIINLGDLFAPIIDIFFPADWAIVGGKIFGGLFLMYVFDINALAQFFTHVYGSHTEKQSKISYKVFMMDFIGAVIMSAAQLFLGMSGLFERMPPELKTGVAALVLVTTTVVFILNLYYAIQFRLNGPDIIEATHQATLQRKKTEDRHNRLKEQADHVATLDKMAQDYEAALHADLLTDYQQFLDRVAPDIKERRRKQFMERAGTVYGLNQTGPEILAATGPAVDVEARPIDSGGDEGANFTPAPRT